MADANQGGETGVRIPLTAARVLEIDAVDQGLRDDFLSAKPLASYSSVNIRGGAAGIPDGDLLDAIVCNNSLEKMLNPWEMLARLRARASQGGVCIARISNVGHWSVIFNQLKGRWDYEEQGIPGAGNIRFFTLDTAVAMFHKVGWIINDIQPVYHRPEDPAIVNFLHSAASGLGISAGQSRQNLTVKQWIIRAVNGPRPEPVNVVALGLKKIAGVTEARVDHPMAALATLPGVRVVWGAGNVTIPRDWKQGVFILHRQFMNEKKFQQSMERLVQQGWLLVADMDDDPHHWQEYVDSDFYAFRGVHAVTVSTATLADLMREWNPHVRVFPNAISRLPEISHVTPKQDNNKENNNRVRIFFGALNRGADWESLRQAISSAALLLGNTVEFVVVHDRDFHDMLPEGILREYHPTLPPEKYMEVLASCDIGLLPLEDNRFNRLKSDLKFIECCAAGVVPLCSPVVYGENPVHQNIGVFAENSREWKEALLFLVNNPDQIRLRRERGLSYVKAERMHAHQVKDRANYYRQLFSERRILEDERQLRLGRHRP